MILPVIMIILPRDIFYRIILCPLLILTIITVVECFRDICQPLPWMPPQQDIEIGHISQINKTTVETKTIIKLEDVEEKDGTCSICLEEFGIGHEFLCISKCRHVFHRCCIDAWLENDRSCPICRYFVDWCQLERGTKVELLVLLIDFFFLTIPINLIWQTLIDHAIIVFWHPGSNIDWIDG